MATPLGGKVFFHNKEMMLQCNGQSAKPITVETLVIHFDQENFLGTPLWRCVRTPYMKTQECLRVAKTPVAIDQKAAPTEVVSKPMSTACAVERTSLQFPSVSTKSKLTSCQHGGISCKAK